MLSFLEHECRPAPEWDVRARPSRRVSMDLMPRGSVVDYDFGTTDVFMILRVESISPRYINYYSAEAERFLA